jgi:hypothetical protein
MRSTGFRAPAGAGIDLGRSRRATAARSVDCTRPAPGKVAAQAECCLSLAVAVLGAKARLLGMAVMDDAALRPTVSQRYSNICEQVH